MKGKKGGRRGRGAREDMLLARELKEELERRAIRLIASAQDRQQLKAWLRRRLHGAHGAIHAMARSCARISRASPTFMVFFCFWCALHVLFTCFYLTVLI